MTDKIVDEADPVEVQPMTIPKDLQIQIKGFDERQAREAGHKLMHVIKKVSRLLPLNNLDGVTVAYDYKEELASVERGCTTNVPTAPTQDEVGEGVAMELPVMRDGVCKTHIVFGPSIVGLLIHDEPRDLRTVLQLVVHELGHAADHEHKRQALGEIMFTPINDLIPDAKEQYLWELSHHIWDEYFASRVSAKWGPDAERFEEELFVKIYSVFRERIREARVKYHWHKMTLEDLFAVIKHNFNLMLLATGYLFGLCDGLEKPVTDVAPRAAALLNGDDAKQLWRFRDVLLMLWGRLGKWQSYDEFTELNRPTEILLNELEFFVHVMDTGELYMDVPVRL